MLFFDLLQIGQRQPRLLHRQQIATVEKEKKNNSNEISAHYHAPTSNIKSLVSVSISPSFLRLVPSLDAPTVVMSKPTSLLPFSDASDHQAKSELISVSVAWVSPSLLAFPKSGSNPSSSAISVWPPRPGGSPVLLSFSSSTCVLMSVDEKPWGAGCVEIRDWSSKPPTRTARERKSWTRNTSGREWENVNLKKKRKTSE